MTTPEQFLAQIKNLIPKYQRNMGVIYQMSVADVIRTAQTPTAKGGRMRVDTGFLRNSLVGELRGTVANVGGDGYNLVIAQADAGEPLAFSWTAAYAVAREFGARGQQPDFYARAAAQQWEKFVNLNARLVADA